MRIITYIAIFLCIANTSFSRGQLPIPTDSLQSILSKVKSYYYDYDYKNAIESGANLLEEAKKANDTYYIFRGYNELGQVHYALKDTVKGKFYFEKALQHAKNSKVDSLISWAYNDLGNIYAEDKTKFDKSISYYKKAIEVNKRAKRPDYKNLVQYVNIGWTYLDKEEPEQAYPYLTKSDELTKLESQHPLLLLNLKILFGRYHFYIQEYDNALDLLLEAAQTAAEENYLDQASQANQYLYKTYSQLENYKLANTHLLAQQEFDKKLHQVEKDMVTYEASAKLEVAQYQKDLAVAEKEKIFKDRQVEKSNLLTTIFIFSSIVLLIGMVLFYSLFKVRKKFIAQLHQKNKELTRAKNKAEKLSTLKTQFFSTVSHELRTPLYGVIGLSSILMEDKNLATHKEDLTSLKFSADYLLALINDVLTLNKIDADGITVEKTMFKLDTLLKNLIKSFAFSLQQNKNKIHLTIDEDLPKQFLGDSVRLSQIIMNLVGNSVKFNENGNIWITIKLKSKTEDGNYLTQFIIKDDGIGIPKDKQESIFEEFSQVENKNYNYQGTGLGLPIVKKLLTLFDSEIQLTSEVGKGATFSFELLLEKAGTVSEKSLSKITSEEIITQNNIIESVHVLVVDDNKINQKITQKILETRSFQCSLANDGLEAIEKVKNGSYDLILMDIHMPKMNGIEATKAIRKFDSNIPIVALTAVEIAEIRDAIETAGMNDIILKPYDVSQFLSTILRNLNVYAIE